MYTGSLSANSIGGVHQYQGVIDHHASQTDYAEQAQKAQVKTHEQMSEHGAHDAERNGRHDHKWLRKGFERNGQQGVNEKKRDNKATDNIVQGLLLFLSFPFHGVPQAWITQFQFWHDPAFQISTYFIGVGDSLIHVSGHLDYPETLSSLDGGVALLHLHLGHLVEWNLGAVRRPDVHLLNGSQ